MTWQKVELDTKEIEKQIEEQTGVPVLVEEVSESRVEKLKQIFNEAQERKKRGRPAKDKLSSSDPVNSPAHYTDGGIETIDYIEAKNLNYHLGNVVKYVSRAGKKGEILQDLEKAMWYLTREIERLKAQQ
jgi:hypothetical protein